MGFDIYLEWPRPAEDGMKRNHQVRQLLLEQFSGLRNFPLDHDLISAQLEIERGDVLQHWPQYEIHGTKEDWANVTITLWLDCAYLSLTSVPVMTCAETLQWIQPILHAFASWGYVVEESAVLLEEYEKQRDNVIFVARMIHNQ